MNFKGKLWLCALFLAGFWACSDDDSENLNEEVTDEDVNNVASIDDATVIFSDAVNISNEILSDEEVMAGRVQQCYSVNPTETENQLLVTFESNCEGLDGKVRSGSFLIEWSGSMETNDFSYTVSFDGYKADEHGLGGSITVSDLTYTENGFGFNVVVNDGIVNYPDGKQVIYEQDLDYNFSFGEIMELRITGSSTGTGKEGNSYIANIKEPLLVVSGCEYAVSGSFEATFNGRPPVTVSYGDGGCDNKAIASRGDFSVTFELD